MKNTSGIAVSCIGASHIKSGKECQDRSKYISGKKFSAIVVCDGHGGDKHFRSATGAEFAISCFEKAISEFADKYHSLLKRSKAETILRNFEKHMIFSWREAVESHCNENPFTEEELKIFPEYIRDELKENPHIAYGSTFLACFVIKDELFVVQLGDGEIRLIIGNGQVVSPIIKDENLKFGMTTSLCNADAIRYVKSVQTKIGDITGWIMNTHLDDKGLSKFKTYTTDRAIYARPVKNKKLTSSVKLFKGITYTLICEIEKGEYSGYRYIGIENRRYYI